MAAPLIVAVRNLADLLRCQTAKVTVFGRSQTWRNPPARECIRTYTNIREVKKFYRRATIATSDGWYEINLDKRKLKTPGGGVFRVPNEALALAVATEWNGQEKTIKRQNMHLTNLCNTAIDNPQKLSRHDFVEFVIQRLESDTIFFRVKEPIDLMELQTAEWDPIMQWANERYNLTLGLTYGIVLPAITQGSKDIIRRHLHSFSDWALFGYQDAVSTLRSVLLVMAVVDRHISVERAVELTTLEYIFQAKRWGTVAWYHDLDKYSLHSRLASAVLFIHWCSENSTVRQKASLPIT